ncbi:MAG TPA: Asp-tRNA(Asn)/Glu-tRNA(Gln) amidotransferase subunit GatB [Kofleriaceae bacterium]|jgi:aspartyl-tRNA(Asn)/glutamyl-tRNA(Gln) amidotransferase subunit B|nr:Asp-tRNA(Asn)/Glu-tRNA(Gln) amidotransferase subunit GatB [Kofleriaceae bacterium]
MTPSRPGRQTQADGLAQGAPREPGKEIPAATAGGRDPAKVLEEWEPVIGLEVHVQLATHSKIFSPSAVEFGAPPNSLTDPLVLGLPGTLPVFNQAVLQLALRLGVATSSQIRARSRFARKHYFYPDLPKGYQISQFDEPLCENGHLDVILRGGLKRIKLQRIHLEEDAGKTSHVGAESHVDLNRAGVPLVEVVSAPELLSAEEAGEFMRSLHRLVRWLEISEGDMEKGQMRCDANVSIRRRGEDRLGTRTELKNINSFRFVENAIEHEIARQIRLIESGERIVRETRLWDAERGQSQPMRSKEEANDYRYFPDPDLPPLVVDGQIMAQTLRSLPELPNVRFDRYQKLGISADDARTLVSERSLADYFDAVLAAHPGERSGRMLANWVLTELLGALHARATPVAQSPMAPAALSALVVLVENGTISGKIGKDVFEECFRTGEAPAAIVERRGLQQISDTGALWEIINRIVAANPKQAEAYTVGGKDGLFGFFVGQVMKETQGRANPVITSDLLHKRLGR